LADFGEAWFSWFVAVYIGHLLL